MIYISRVPGLGLIDFGLGLGLEKFLWPRPYSLWPRPWPRAKLASLTTLTDTGKDSEAPGDFVDCIMHAAHDTAQLLTNDN